MSSLVISENAKKADIALMQAFGYNHSPIAEVIKLGSKVIAVNEWLKQPDIFNLVKALKGKSTGFLVDFKGCDDKQLAEAVTEALLNGFRLDGNEFNIISGRFMGVLNGYMRLCSTFENDSVMITDFQIFVSDIVSTAGSVTVSTTVQYAFMDKKTNEIKKQPDFQRKVFLTPNPKLNENTDSWSGKAKRRTLKDFLAFLTGKVISDYDWEDQNPEPIKPTVGTTTKKTMEVQQAKEKTVVEKAIDVAIALHTEEQQSELHMDAPELGEL